MSYCMVVIELDNLGAIFRLVLVATFNVETLTAHVCRCVIYCLAPNNWVAPTTVQFETILYAYCTLRMCLLLRFYSARLGVFGNFHTHITSSNIILHHSGS